MPCPTAQGGHNKWTRDLCFLDTATFKRHLPSLLFQLLFHFGLGQRSMCLEGKHPFYHQVTQPQSIERLSGGGLAQWQCTGLDQPSYSTPGPVITGTGDHLWTGKPRFVTSHSSQLSLLSSVGRKISTGQSAVTLCGWGAFIPLVDTCVGGRYNCVIPR